MDDEFCPFCEESGCFECDHDDDNLSQWLEPSLDVGVCDDDGDDEAKWQDLPSQNDDLPQDEPGEEDDESDPALPYKLVHLSGVPTERALLIEDMRTTLDVSSSDADLLLRYYRYDGDKLEEAWFSGSEAVRDEVGLCAGPPFRKVDDDDDDNDDDDDDDDEGKEAEVQCAAWCSVVPISEAHALKCGHHLCNDCWAGMLAATMSEGLTALMMRCPGMTKDNKKCRELVTLDTWKRYLSAAAWLKFEKWLSNAFVDAVPHYKWCPRPDCDYAVYNPSGGAITITCFCKTRFCFKCTQPPHSPVPCDLVAKWVLETGTNAQEIASQKLIEATAKPCPSCNTFITKDRHCNHMKCTKCSHHFCWLCLQPFTRETGHNDYYKCASYNQTSEKGEVSKEENKQVDSNKYLQKLLLHKNRVEDCKADRTKSLKIHTKLRQARLRGGILGNTRWLTDVVEDLAECFRVLQWSHVLAYFMQQCNQKELFVQQQEALESQAHSLLKKLSEGTIDKILFSELRARTRKQSEILAKHRHNLALYTGTGFEDVILNEPDKQSSAWACVSCSAVNQDRYAAGSRGKVSKCSTCNACREHGEPDCRAPKCGIQKE